LTTQQIAYCIILLSAFILLITRRLRIDAVAILIVLALAITGILTPEEALSGFSSEPAIVVAAIFVLSGALEYTGVAESIGRRIGIWAGNTFSRAILVIMPAVAVLSAFTHHLTTTAIMLPVLVNFSRERDIPASKILMPLSFAASLGTTITIIGAPAFLVASEALQNSGRPGLGVFSIAPIGIALSLAGTLFVLIAGRFLLPARQGTGDMVGRFRLDNYYTEITIQENSPFIGKTLEQVKNGAQYKFNVVGWERERQLHRIKSEMALQSGDVLRVYISPEDLVTIREDQGIELRSVDRYGVPDTGNEEDEDIDLKMVQTVVSPGSELIGRTIRDMDFRRRYGAIVVGLWRQRGFLRSDLAGVQLREGDVLLLQGDADSLARIDKDPAFLMLTPFQAEARLPRKAPLSALIMLATVITAALGVLPLEIAAVAGAITMILTGCITPRRAYRSIDPRIFVFIAGAVPLGLAMERSGVSELVAQWLQGAVGGWSPTLVLIMIFILCGVITQFLSDAATTALFAPIAVALASALGMPPEQTVVTVAMASIVAFLTPLGHHGNLLVYGPGNYQFADFIRVGAPLTVVAGVVVVLLVQVVFR
jgi:di/tricarboxylate transporter